MEKNTKIVIGTIALLLVMIFIFNSEVTGMPWLRPQRRVTCPTPTAVGVTYCSGNNIMQNWIYFTRGRQNCRQQSMSPKLIQTCSGGYVCKNGICVRCGNGYCDSGENHNNCPEDCIPCAAFSPPYCPNGTFISAGIDPITGCSLGVTCCGDRVCRGKETESNCEDCI